MSSHLPHDIAAFVTSVSPARLTRYARSGSAEDAARQYLWHCQLCEAFYISLHFAEIVTRNAIASRLEKRLGPVWFEHRLLRSLLPPRFEQELRGIVQGDRALIRSDEVIAAMTLGFWQHFLTKRYDRLLWSHGLRETFPFAPDRVTREDVHSLIESVRLLRNRIAHHRPIFDRAPSRRHQDALTLIGLRCIETRSFVARLSRVPIALANRPA